MALCSYIDYLVKQSILRVQDWSQSIVSEAIPRVRYVNTFGDGLRLLLLPDGLEHSKPVALNKIPGC